MTSEFKYINQTEKGVRLDSFLADQSGLELSRAQIKKLIEAGDIIVNGQASKPSQKLKLDDQITVQVPPPREIDAKAENIPLNIIHEDKDLIVINKPQGMVVHPAAGNHSGTLVNALLYHCQDLSGIGGIIRPGIVHRLDKDTSGLMVVAKNNHTHQALDKQFKVRKIFKQYIALVRGVVKEDSGVIDKVIGRHPINRKKMAVIKTPKLRGRMATTIFKVIKRFKNYSLLDLVLKTGRTHQIRVHLHSIGHPVVGDQVYGRQKEEF